ncbi:MAG: class I SAM-dependent methyltransferase [Rickettsiaceae bacterium]|nr:class I SAM-dependent methyltransferase [Rickettsiaceae bacterium]
MLKFNSKNGSNSNIAHHYDLGNDFYSLWLDRDMTYSGVLFAGNKKLSLEDSQKASEGKV